MSRCHEKDFPTQVLCNHVSIRRVNYSLGIAALHISIHASARQLLGPLDVDVAGDQLVDFIDTDEAAALTVARTMNYLTARVLAQLAIAEELVNLGVGVVRLCAVLECLPGVSIRHAGQEVIRTHSFFSACGNSLSEPS